MTRLIDYQIDYHGIHHRQYFPGVGVSGTIWEECVTGAGGSPSEALDNALDTACLSTSFPDVDADTIELEIAKLRDQEDLDGCDDVEDDETYYYVTLFWKYR